MEQMHQNVIVSGGVQIENGGILAPEARQEISREGTNGQTKDDSTRVGCR